MTPAPEDDHPDATRIHLAAHDPGFPALRDRAFADLAAAVDGTLQPLGLTRRGQGWATEGPAGRGVVHLGRDRYGWAATLTLRWQAAGAEEDEEVALADLAPVRLVYADLATDPALTRAVTDALAGPAMDWLRARGARPG